MTTIRASLTTRLIAAVIGIVICLPGVNALWLGQLQGFAFIIVGGAFALVPIARFAISWDEESLTYRGLAVTRRVRLADVNKFDIHGPTIGDRFGSTLGLRIFSSSPDVPVMTINVKPFSREQLQQLILRLKEATAG